MTELLIAELFAGVGGFRVGFNDANAVLGTDQFKVIWSNQWEPSTKVQHASDVYVRQFGATGHSNVDIGTVPAADVPTVDILVGGFPCQDYSVATTLQRSDGLIGKKGVLWWEIHRLLRDKAPRPGIVMLENVDRLLKSPANQRGRDFAVMLASLADLGYAVEWRVINAAEYGMPQRRRRVFIMGYHRDSPVFEAITGGKDTSRWLTETGIMATAFPVSEPARLLEHPFHLVGNLAELTKNFNKERPSTSPFENAGLMLGREVVSLRLEAAYSGPAATLGDVIITDESLIPDEYFIGDELPEWEYLKGPKRLKRVNRTTGHTYEYSEGGIAFPDPLNRPSRTIITGEGGRGPSRFKHVIRTSSGRYRRLVPVELERLNMFSDEHTAGVSDSRRAFLMGNALVTGIVQQLAVSLAHKLKSIRGIPLPESKVESSGIEAGYQAAND